MATTVVLAEDSYIVREGVRLMLESAGYQVLGVAEDLDGLLASVATHSPEVVVTDIRMPPTHTDEGVRAARRIRAEHPDIGVVVLSQYAEPEYALHLLEDGSGGLAYLLKERVGDLGELEAAIAAVGRGESVVDARVVETLVRARVAETTSKISRLSERELEVLAELAKGSSNTAIARTLVISERGVEKHINSIFTKLDLLPEGDVNRRVRAALMYLTETGA